MLLSEVTPDDSRAIADKPTALRTLSGSRILSEPELSLGSSEGLGIYLNGTDSPDETYRDCDVDVVYSEFNRLLGSAASTATGRVRPKLRFTYTAGTAAEMRTALQPFPLPIHCARRARIVQIAPASDGEGHLS